MKEIFYMVTYSGFALHKLTPSRGRGLSGAPKFLSPVPPTPWLLPCLGGDSLNGKALLFEMNLQRISLHKLFHPIPPLPFPAGRGNFLILFCREASPPAPRVRGVYAPDKEKLVKSFRFITQILRLSAWRAIASHGANIIFQILRLFAGQIS